MRDWINGGDSDRDLMGVPQCETKKRGGFMSENENRPETTTTADVLTRNWWVLALRGVLGIVFGVLAFIWPGITFVGLIYFFGIYALINGGFAFSSAAGNP